MRSWQPVQGYELVVGMEIHAELCTKTKIFCSCPTGAGAAPNTQCCPVCMGFPGALPVLNQNAVRLAVLAGLATGCEIALRSQMDRKHYFYPDLPKAYQITQFYHPICQNGRIGIDTPTGTKSIGITRIHLEEDAGKLIHQDDRKTLIDFNRCGVPLIEIVSEPDIRTPEEAVGFFRALRSVLRCAGVTSGRMNEGALRADINLSVHRPGTPFGVRTEIKNLNSFQSVQRAIESEYLRQVALVQSGKTVVQETRRFDQASGQTFSMRRKENADDYRFCPEPDLAPIVLDSAWIEQCRRSLPRMPGERKDIYINTWRLPAGIAGLLASDRFLSDWFEACAARTRDVQTLAKLVTDAILPLRQDEDQPVAIPPEQAVAIIAMINSQELSVGSARKVLAALFNGETDPRRWAEANDLIQLNDPSLIQSYIQKAIDDRPDLVRRFLAGKASVVRALIGQAMDYSNGKANPVLLARLMEETLARISLKN